MSTLETLLNDVRLNDAMVQEVLRGTEPDVFEKAILGLSERHRRIFLRNMSIRANDIVRDHIAKIAGTTPAEDIESAQTAMALKLTAVLETSAPKRKEFAIPALETALADKRLTDTAVQNALRNIDSRVLSCALTSLPQKVRDVFYRNMAKRAVQMTQTTITEEGASFSDAAISEAQGMLAEFIGAALSNERLSRDPDRSRDEKLPPLPAFRLSDEEEIIRTFMTLSWYIKKYGLLSIEDAAEHAENPVFKKGIDLLVNGWEPMTSRTLLENLKKAYLSAVERRTAMIMEGFAGLQDGIETAALEEKLRSHTI